MFAHVDLFFSLFSFVDMARLEASRVRDLGAARIAASGRRKLGSAKRGLGSQFGVK
jgi:hypothetical protein